MNTNGVRFMFHKCKLGNPTEEILQVNHNGIIGGLRIFDKVTFNSQSAQFNNHLTGKACLSTLFVYVSDLSTPTKGSFLVNI